MISLFALILTLGIVVDDAIVVAEYADFRARGWASRRWSRRKRRRGGCSCRSSPRPRRRSIAFFGLVAIGGRFGDLIADIPFTVIVVLLASLMECFLILPNHMAHALAHTAKEHWYDWPSRQFNKGFRWFRTGSSAGSSRAWSSAALSGAGRGGRAPRVAGGALHPGRRAVALLRRARTSSISGNFAMLPGATREDTLAFMRALQGAVEDLARVRGGAWDEPAPLRAGRGGRERGVLRGGRDEGCRTFWAASRSS